MENDKFEIVEAKISALKEKAKVRAYQFMNDPDLDHFAKEYIIGSLSENTLRAYASDLKIFRHWCEGRNLTYLPATPNCISNFLAAQAKIKSPSLKASTISRRLAAIQYAHKLAGLSLLPTADLLVRQTMQGIMREKLVAPSQKSPATQDLIYAMVEQIDTSNLLGVRDKAIILLGFAGAFRRSELAAIQVDDLDIHDKGMSIFIRSSKTDQTGEGYIKPILNGKTYCPVQATKDWLSQSNIDTGFLFRGFKPNSQSKLKTTNHEASKPDISDKLIARVVKKYIGLIGLNPSEFAGHSLRSGFVTAALLNGASYEKIMEVTGQKDIKTLMKYYRNIEHFNNHAGNDLL